MSRRKRKAWCEIMNYTEMILGMAAGLGLFLYGMELMSKGMEKVAGSKMKSVLEMCTKNRFVGVIVGILFTAVIQSSSVTTSMVVSFVNSGLMTLTQAVGPILGANIGTTITGQLVSFDLAAIAPVFIFAGVILILFSKKRMVNHIGEILLGFGVLFFGISTMSSAMNDVKQSPEIMDVIKALNNPFLAILTGFAITAIIQSSSASVGIIITMAAAGVITELPMVFFMILGCNIGSCVTACIVSLSGKKEAKRTALIHLYVNIFGSAVIAVILLIFGEQIAELMKSTVSGGTPEHVMSRAVANAHTIFKIFQVIIMFPFAKIIVKLTQLTVRGEDKKAEGFQLMYISQEQMTTPSASLIEVINEIKRMGKLAAVNLQTAFDAMIEKDQAKIDSVY